MHQVMVTTLNAHNSVILVYMQLCIHYLRLHIHINIILLLHCGFLSY